MYVIFTSRAGVLNRGLKHEAIAEWFRSDKAAVPNLFCATDQFHKRQHFQGPAINVWGLMRQNKMIQTA